MKATEAKSQSIAKKPSSFIPGKRNENFFINSRKNRTRFFGPASIQPKLKIGQPNDKYEQQADRVADRVIQMPDSQIQQKCDECEKGKVHKKAEVKASDSGKSFAGHQLSSQIKSSAGNGSPLPGTVQSEMGQKIGVDFSGVNIHTDSKSHQLNKQLGARAFTHGSDIYFNKGNYAPETNEGKWLLAHELTHVVQQNDAGMQIQKDDENGSVPSPDAEDDSFAFDYEILPPSLKFTIGNWMLQANTGSAEVQFSQNLLRYSLGYNYGGSIFAGFNRPGFGTQLGVNPTSGETSLSFTHNQFRFGGSVNPGSGAFGLNVGFGAPLLPMPSDLSESVYGGWAGASSILGGLSSMQDPISFYQAHSNDVDAVMGAVRALQPLAGEEGIRFGAGLKFNYNPDTGVLFGGGMQWQF